MASWTTPTTFATGNVLDVASANAWSNDLIFLYECPYAIYCNAAGATLTNAAATQVPLDTTVASGYGFSIASGDAIVPITGVYQVSFAINTLLNANTTEYIAGVYLNGTPALQGGTISTPGGYTTAGGAGMVSCAAGSSLQLVGLQNSGSNATTTPGAVQTYLHAHFVGSQ